MTEETTSSSRGSDSADSVSKTGDAVFVRAPNVLHIELLLPFGHHRLNLSLQPRSTGLRRHDPLQSDITEDL